MTKMKCVYCGKSVDKGEGVRRSLHRLPTKRPRELQFWLKNLSLQNDKQPLEHLRLCSEHFPEECFTRENGTVKLRQGSIPTLFHARKHQRRKCIYCNVPKTGEGDRTFHKFPLQNSVQLRKWLSGIPLQNFFPTKDNILCSDHFEPNCFRRVNNRLRLKALVVPTIFKPVLLTEMNVSSSKMEATAAASFEKSESVGEMETTTEMETTIDVDSTRDLVPAPIIPSTPTGSRQERRPNTPVSIYSVRHDHCYEISPRSLKIKLASARRTIKKLMEECKLNRKRIKRLTTKISSLKDIARMIVHN